jgi:hypothetical protein
MGDERRVSACSRVRSFRRALRKLDLERGDALGTLTEAEVQMVISSCDANGDNQVDGREWCDRFGTALQRLSGEGLLTDVADQTDDLLVERSGLMPACLEDGVWPTPDEWGVSDHGVVTSSFGLRHP